MKKISNKNIRNLVLIVCGVVIVVGVVIVIRLSACSSAAVSKATEVSSKDKATEELNARKRPGSVYKPSATPTQFAEREDINALIGGANADVVEEDSDEDSEENLDDEELVVEEVVEEVVPIPHNDPALLTMTAEQDFMSMVWNAIESPGKNLVEEGNLFIGSQVPQERAYGAILLYQANAFNDDIVDAIMSDSDAMVPLAVYDWIRDFGRDEDIALYSDAIKDYNFTKDELYAYINDSASSFGGGRSALDLWLSSYDQADIPVDLLANIVTAKGASYDVKSQALFKLLEPETKKVGLESIENAATGLDADSGVLMPQTIEKWRELSKVANSDGDTEKIWDSESSVVLYLAESGKGLVARDLANYLEYALRRDDPECDPVIELGTWEFANEFLENTLPNRDTLSAVELDALDRIASSLDRLVKYDPAFNPFEEVGENEVIPEEFFEEEVASDEIVEGEEIIDEEGIADGAEVIDEEETYVDEVDETYVDDGGDVFEEETVVEEEQEFEENLPLEE